MVHAIQDEDGTLHTNQDKVLDLAVDYFKEILQEPPEDALHQTAMEDVLNRTIATVSQAEKDTLQKPFELDELHTVAKLLGRHKCPGPDGVPLEFFLIFWETVSPLLMQATVQGLQQGIMLSFFNKGAITLLPKEGDTTLLKNKRLITMLNAVYKT
ncbi:hypothetical protein R1sor_016566 [Riccia sorocarpa]|uniref:Reverse transcriptase n=1 Tax=Riccia sorocarpa TaxID=122646 RepID=A0ABD3HFE9_9MARC